MRRYRVHSELGKGGFGRVFRVREEGPAIAPDLALKLLHAGSADDEAVRRLRDEARMLVALRHPNVVRLYRFVELHTGPALLLELVDGANLSDVLQFGPAPPRAALELVATVAEALRYAWTCPGEDGQPLRLLHRDVKPGNLALSAEAEVKLLDFGIAWADLSAREAKTGPEPRGTPTYMAPERRLLVDTPTVDVFGLGLVLFNLLTCEAHPELPESPEGWEGFQATLAERLARKLGMDCPQRQAITALVHEAVAWRPEDRPLPAAFGVRASVLARAMAGPGLKGWASQVVPRVLALAPSAAPVVGEVLEEVESQGAVSAEVAPEERSAARTWGSGAGRPIALGDPRRASSGRDAEREPEAAPSGGPGAERTPTGRAARGGQEPAGVVSVARALAPEAARALPPPPPPRRWPGPVVVVVLLLGTVGAALWRGRAGPDETGAGSTRAPTRGLVDAALDTSNLRTGMADAWTLAGRGTAAPGLGDSSSEGPSPGVGSPWSPGSERAAQVLVGVAQADAGAPLVAGASWRSLAGPPDGPPTAPDAPSEPAAPSDAQVSVAGDATLVELVSARGAVRLPASVPPGAYTLRVDFLHADRPFSYGVVQLAPGGQYEVACDGSVLVCRTREVR